MREIKFRAWDKRFNNMIYDKPMAILYLKDDNHEIMQFTGLLDKQGKEIYEGDIVKHTPTFPELEGKYHIGEIKIEPSRGICVNNIPLAFGPEVIGNIYENPELLP